MERWVRERWERMFEVDVACVVIFGFGFGGRGTGGGGIGFVVVFGFCCWRVGSSGGRWACVGCVVGGRMLLSSLDEGGGSLPGVGEGGIEGAEDILEVSSG